MDNETLNPLINRIDVLENRLHTIEDQKRNEGLGWGIVKGIGKGIMGVGALGGLIALLNFAWDFPQKMKERIAMPDTVTQSGEQLDLTWTQGGN
jgi:hypothetical protein